MPAPEALGLYVHVPFCEVQCAYCHFAIDPRRRDAAREERDLGALLSELEDAEQGFADTLYFGGGTPSLMSAGRLARVVEAARRRFALAAGAEVTLEANPHDLDLEGCRALLAAGVTRLSHVSLYLLEVERRRCWGTGSATARCNSPTTTWSPRSTRRRS